MVIPGVTSAIAVPAYAGIPVTDRRAASSVAIVTGHEDSEKESSTVNWSELARATDTIVVLMGMKHLDEIARDEAALPDVFCQPEDIQLLAGIEYRQDPPGTFGNLLFHFRYPG